MKQIFVSRVFVLLADRTSLTVVKRYILQQVS